MSNNVVLARNFNTAKCSFSPVRTLDSGGKQAYINYDGGLFVLQTPECTLPYGMSKFDKAGPVKYSVELSLRGYDEEGSKMKQFYDALAKLDDFMIEQGVKNSRAWFKAEPNREVIKAFYTPMIRFSLDKEGNKKPYPPTFKLSLKQKRDSDDFDVAFYDDKQTAYRGIPANDLLVKGAQMVALIQCTGVWFAGAKFGLSWKLTQAVMRKLPQSAKGFTFVDDGDLGTPSRTIQNAVADDAEEEEEEETSEEEEDEAFAAPAPVVAKPSVVAAVLPKKVVPAPVAESLDDAADDVEPVPIPKKTVTSAPAVVKKKIVAKK